MGYPSMSHFVVHKNGPQSRNNLLSYISDTYSLILSFMTMVFRHELLRCSKGYEMDTLGKQEFPICCCEFQRILNAETIVWAFFIQDFFLN